MLLVGPGGVFVVDVKNWRSVPETSGGKLSAGGEPRDEHAAKLLAVTKAAELGRIRLLGEHEVGPALLGERGRLRTESVRAIADHLERVFPDYEGSRVGQRAQSVPAHPQQTESDGLFGLSGLRDAALEEALRAPIEQWMTFLHPDQVALVRRNWSGPARISGPAGTGKTVVGLHRAAHLARRTSGRILYVTFANNLPRVQSTFLTTMSPAVADRVDFRSLHSWAHEFLQERGVQVRLHGDKAETAFSLAWKRVGRDSRLAEIDPAPPYWRDEIAYVIKGRGITTYEDYAAVPRRRRRTTLRQPHRQAVWALYEEYESLRVERGVHDFNDVLSLALAEAKRRTDGPRHAAVIVDEVQDLTLVGVRLLHAMVGDAPNGLLLVGDGQQAVYPGGFRLADAGIDIRGDRGQVLRTNYRNSKQILDTALAVVADDSFDDIDGLRTPGRRDVDGARADAAVLCPSMRAISHYQRLLTQAEIPVCLLEHYDGRPVDAVKLGTYRRAKGLEFKCVYLPQHDAALAGKRGPVAAAMSARAERSRPDFQLSWLGRPGMRALPIAARCVRPLGRSGTPAPL